MPDQLEAKGAIQPEDSALDENDSLRLLSRSPHPYHRLQSELLEPSDTLAHRATSSQLPRADHHGASSFSKESTPGSDSGTEADDEHFLKGLPAPRIKSHKGLRGRNEQLSGTTSPQLSPAVLEENNQERAAHYLKRNVIGTTRHRAVATRRRSADFIRRATELFLLVALGSTLYLNANVKPIILSWSPEILCIIQLVAVLLLMYPFRLVLWIIHHGGSLKTLRVSIPSSLDPAPLLYPLAIPIFVSFLIATSDPAAVLPNLVLGLCSIPRPLIPGARSSELYSMTHWLFSSLPLFRPWEKISVSTQEHVDGGVSHDTLMLLYPLHQSLCFVLFDLTTTSLLPAELQLLSISLIDILLLAQSPQTIIMKALLWGGGTSLLVLCGQVIKWGIALARVPKWRFRRLNPSVKKYTFRSIVTSLFVLDRRRQRYGHLTDTTSCDSAASDGDADDKQRSAPSSPCNPQRLNDINAHDDSMPLSSTEKMSDAVFGEPHTHVRRHTLPHFDRLLNRSKTHTPSGRRKRSASWSVRAFFTLTQGQAAVRKWAYAVYVYICILAIILVGIREYIGRFALNGEEPIGWALGYLFGDLPSFRFEVVKANLEGWICLPPREGAERDESCSLGWVQHLRQASLGEANTRLILSAYFIAVLVTGLAVVFRLSPVCEVDTRRKVFHFMMVAMFLPATYVDPTFAALALSLVLSVFLLLDMLRASQLPPLSKPIAAFLTPYVDGRDLRGPVVISHIFLLIGCAVPLWLSLGTLPRTGSGYFEGWEVPTRDVSMVAGVVCVGLGDAAASLIGRRWGHRKWIWGGGKSLEGSVAFAVAVFIGLMAAHFWLKLGGWTATGDMGVVTDTQGFLHRLRISGLSKTVRDAGFCASMASLTEAVLTGGNDNVVVPVVLWTCVKGLGL